MKSILSVPKHVLGISLFLLMCNPVFSQSIDTDGDGVFDDVDLDDDNDGILDEDEGNICDPGFIYATGSWDSNGGNVGQHNGGQYTPVSSAVSPASIGSGITSYALAGSNDFPADTQDGTASAIAVYGVNQSTFADAKANDDYVELEFTTDADFLGVEYTLSDFRYAQYFLQSNGLKVGGEFQYALEISSDNFTTSSLFIDTRNYGTPGVDQIDAPLSSSFNGLDYDVLIANATNNEVLQEGTTYTVRFYLFGDSDGKVLIDDLTFDVISCQTLDTDSDGTADHLDTDSDNDGCPDALEGDENVVLGQLNPNGSIDTTVAGIDSDGVPNLVNNGGSADGGGDQGQAVGNSTTVSPLPSGCLGTISGNAKEGTSGINNVTLTLYEDTNNNGIYDSGVDQLIDQTTTALDGTYTFINVNSGEYFVVQTQPVGFTLTSDEQSIDGDTYANSNTTDGIIPVTVSTDESDLENNFLYQGVSTSITDDTDRDGIVNHLDLDDDNDGILDVDEGYICNDGFDYATGSWDSNATGAVVGQHNGGQYPPIASAVSPASIGSGITSWALAGSNDFPNDTQDGTASAVAVYGVNQSTFADAKANGDYVEMQFTTITDFLGKEYTLDAFRYGQYFFQSNGTRVGGDFQYAVEFSTNGFTTSSIFVDTRNYGTPGVDQIDSSSSFLGLDYDIVVANSSNRITLQEATTYTMRMYLFDDSDGKVLIDDMTFDAVECEFLDTDNDTIADHIDVDSDNDGVTDVIEAGGDDPDNDGQIGTGAIADNDGDGLEDTVDNVDSGSGAGEVTSGTALNDPDTDGDTIKDRLDLDSDNDGVTDIVEAGGLDTDENGVVDNSADTDEDGWADTFDSDNSGTALDNFDTDSDSYNDRIDLDSDNDGIMDIVEAGGVDSDNDGVVDGTFADGDSDGWSNEFDSDNGGTALADTDTDSATNPGTPNRTSLDSDNDGCSDANEYYDTANSDGNQDASDDGAFGDSGTITIATDGTVDQAGYTSSTASNVTNSSARDACTYVQTSNGNWNTPGNWDKGAAPRANHIAEIDDGVQSEVLQNETIKELVLRQNTGINPTTTVEVTGTFTLTVTGNITNNGEFTGDGEVVLDGTLNQDLFGTGDYEKLRINNAAGVDVENTDVTDPTEINGILYVDAGDFTTNDNVLFPCFFEELGTSGSGDFANAKFGQVGPVDGTITGDVTVEQCFPGRRAFRFVSPSTTTTTSIHENWQEGATNWDQNPSPDPTPGDVATSGFGTHITGVAPDPNIDAPTTPTPNSSNNGLDWQPSGNVSMFSFNESATPQQWEDVVDTSSPTLTAGDAYRLKIRGSREVDLTDNTSAVSNTKLRSTGTLATGPIDLTPNINNDQFALIGNPYHAIVDLNKVVPSGSGYTSFVYKFDPTLGGVNDANSSSISLGGRGSFVTVDASTGTSSIASSEANQFIQPYQAFFVRAAPSPATVGSIIFEEDDKAVDQTQIEIFSINTSKQIGVTLYDEPSSNAESTPDDGVAIYFSANGNNAVDANDAPKFPNQDEILSRNEEGSLISFENRAMPEDGEILDLFVMNYRSTNYVMVINVDDFPGKSVYLYDSYTDTETLLANSTFSTYSFTVDQSIAESTATDRFELRISNSTLGNDEFETQGISVYPNPASDVLNVNFGENIGRFDQLELYDVKGQVVRSKTIENQLQQTQLDVNALSTGVYILKISSSKEQFTTKIVVK